MRCGDVDVAVAENMIGLQIFVASFCLSVHADIGIPNHRIILIPTDIGSLYITIMIMTWMPISESGYPTLNPILIPISGI